MCHYSSWYSMKRGLAWLIRFGKFVRGQGHKGRLSVEEVRHATAVLIRKSQSMSFAPEIERLQQGKPVKLSSSLSTLNPFLDDEGLVRVGGRLKESNMKEKHPHIISGSHVVATAVVRDVHNFQLMLVLSGS